MSSNLIGAAIGTLTERWWVPVLRGLAAIIFGVVALVAPSISLLALVMVWGVYAIADGLFNLMLATRAGRTGEQWGWFLFEALVSIGAGAVTFVYPGITTIVLLYLIAAWAIITGVAEIAAAVKLRSLVSGEWMLGLAGVLSIVFGGILFAAPGAGALAVIWLIGSYAIVFGVLLVGLGVKLHRLHREAERAFPTTGAPTAA